MTSTRQKDTKPEVLLRTELHQLGLRYRLHRAVVPGVRRRPDIVFGPAKVVVFVDGCFWHGCPDHGTKPKANAAFWAKKISDNRQRDADTDERRKAAGWKVARVWEHEDPRRAAKKIERAVRRRR